MKTIALFCSTLILVGCAGGSLAWEDPMPKETAAQKAHDKRMYALDLAYNSATTPEAAKKIQDQLDKENGVSPKELALETLQSQADQVETLMGKETDPTKERELAGELSDLVSRMNKVQSEVMGGK